MTVMRAAKVAVLGVAALALGSCSVGGGGARPPRRRAPPRAKRERPKRSAERGESTGTVGSVTD
ncbi:hypothetical protein [Nocardia wallacei]|uniref:hypothetical protein n=1 Tax=Nocardia wallacei TaxID=480035 RepID=UPI0024568482|nr:hypothetical protein [Nocardia wallacei]